MNKIKSKNVKIILKGMIDKDIYSYQQLANKLHVSIFVVKNWFTGRTGMTMETIEKIELLLGVELEFNLMKKDLKGYFYL